jgi:hypothetical protein
VQAALNHLSANEPGKDAQAAKENSQPDVIKLDDACQNIGIVAHRECRMCLGHQVNEDDDGGNEGKKVNPGRFHEKRFLLTSMRTRRCA